MYSVLETISNAVAAILMGAGAIVAVIYIPVYATAVGVLVLLLAFYDRTSAMYKEIRFLQAQVEGLTGLVKRMTTDESKRP